MRKRHIRLNFVHSAPDTCLPNLNPGLDHKWCVSKEEIQSRRYSGVRLTMPVANKLLAAVLQNENNAIDGYVLVHLLASGLCLSHQMTTFTWKPKLLPKGSGALPFRSGALPMRSMTHIPFCHDPHPPLFQCADLAKQPLFKFGRYL